MIDGRKGLQSLVRACTSHLIRGAGRKAWGSPRRPAQVHMISQRATARRGSQAPMEGGPWRGNRHSGSKGLAPRRGVAPGGMVPGRRKTGAGSGRPGRMASHRKDRAAPAGMASRRRKARTGRGWAGRMVRRRRARTGRGWAGRMVRRRGAPCRACPAHRGCTVPGHHPAPDRTAGRSAISTTSRRRSRPIAAANYRVAAERKPGAYLPRVLSRQWSQRPPRHTCSPSITVKHHATPPREAHGTVPRQAPPPPRAHPSSALKEMSQRLRKLDPCVSIPCSRSGSLPAS